MLEDQETIEEVCKGLGTNLAVRIKECMLKRC